MASIAPEKILAVITDFYLDSHDFNGIPAGELTRSLGTTWDELCESVRGLIENDLLGILYPDTEVNTHIIRVGFEPKEVQTAKLGLVDTYHICVYPRPKHLELTVDQSKFIGQPYRLALALGAAQLEFRCFDLAVLEYYRNDPRYWYTADDISGHISARGTDKEPSGLLERDEVVLDTFGYAYDSEMNRAVAVFIRYLADLSDEHQQVWRARELVGDYRLHPDYYRNTVLGVWGEGITIFDAFLSELYFINQMAKAMSRPPLFHLDYGPYNEEKPKRFCFLIRPTLQEFNEFIHLLDKLLSENINRDFFQNEVPYENELTRSDGKVVVTSKGTITLLDDWVRSKFRTSDWSPWDEAISALKKVRKLRQSPAHKVNEDEFDQKYLKQQRELMLYVYDGVRSLRLLLANHRAVVRANIEIPEELQTGKIWTY